MTGRRLDRRLRGRLGALAGEEGSTLPLIAFFGLLSLLLIVVAVAASSLYLERKRLMGLADGAALAGAESFELADVARVPAGSGSSSFRVELQPRRVEAAAAAYLEAVPPGTIEGLQLVRATTVDGRSATITLRSEWRPPIASELLPAGLPVVVTVRARPVLG